MEDNQSDKRRSDVVFVVIVVVVLLILGNPTWSEVKSKIVHALPLTKSTVADFYDTRYAEDGNDQWLEEKTIALTAWANDAKLPRSKREYVAVTHGEFYKSIPPMIIFELREKYK